MHDNGAKAQSCVVQKFCTKGSQTLLSLQDTRKTNVSFHLKRYNLTNAVNFCKTFCTCSPSDLEQDPTVENAKKILIWASQVRNGRFGMFLRKMALVL